MVHLGVGDCASSGNTDKPVWHRHLETPGRGGWDLYGRRNSGFCFNKTWRVKGISDLVLERVFAVDEKCVWSPDLRLGYVKHTFL